MTTPGTPTWLRTHNDRAAFRLFLEHGELSRSRLGELSGLSKPTASQMILRLERVGLIEPVGEVAGARGPNAVSYGVRRDSMTGVAISVLADAMEAVLVDPADADHPVVEVPLGAPAAARTPAGDVRAAVAAACRAAGVAASSVSVVAVGVQAAVDTANDTLSFTDTLPGWPQRGARRAVEDETGLSVILENDVNLATAAERALVDPRDATSFAFVWLGDGLGVGLDIDGAVQRGAFGGAGEVGYLEVPRSAAAIDPDAADFTDLLGGPAVLRLLGAEPGMRLREALAGLDGEAVASLADRVALLVSPILAVLDPGAIVLGGPTGLAGGRPLADLVQERLRREPVTAGSAHGGAAAGSMTHRVAVRTTAAGPQPILRGARRMLVDAIRDRLEAGIAVD